MVISKCVPMQISRKKFSDFEELVTPKEMVFVGWKTIDGKKKNVQVGYEDIKYDLEQWIIENGGFGGGGSTTPDKPTTDNESIEATFARVEAFYFPISESGEEEGTLKWDDENNRPVRISETEYTEEKIYILNPSVGTVTTVVVDNTGRNRKDGETKEEWEVDRMPVDDFTLYYGSADNCYESLTVPAWYRGVV